MQILQEITIIMGNLNAIVGKERDGEIVDQFGLETHNKGGEKWVQWCIIR